MNSTSKYADCELFRLFMPHFPLLHGRYMQIKAMEGDVLVGEIHLYGLTYIHFNNVNTSNDKVFAVTDKEEKRRFIQCLQSPKSYGELRNVGERIKRQLGKIRVLMEDLPRDKAFDLDDITHLYAQTKGTLEVNEDVAAPKLNQLRNHWCALHGLIAELKRLEEKYFRIGTKHEAGLIFPFEFVRINSPDFLFAHNRYLQITRIEKNRVTGRMILHYDNLEIQVPIRQIDVVPKSEQNRLIKWLEYPQELSPLVTAGEELCKRHVRLNEMVKSLPGSTDSLAAAQNEHLITRLLEDETAIKQGDFAALRQEWQLFADCAARLDELEGKKFQRQ